MSPPPDAPPPPGPGPPRRPGGQGAARRTTYRPLPAPDGATPRSIRDSLDRLARHLGVPSSSALRGLFEHWEKLVGPALAAHSRPLSLARGVLVVGVDHPSWAAQLTWLEADLLARLCDGLGAGVVTALSVRVRPI